MKIRAAIFDVYGTLLRVGPAPEDAEAQWQDLCQNHLEEPAPLSLTAFHSACDDVIAREHSIARSFGIRFPEVFWPAVVMEALPSLQKLPSNELDEFLFCEAGLRHAVQLDPGVVPVLSQLQRKNVLLGIASNAQPYSIRELNKALAEAGLSIELFTPDLCFWSFAHGFSKPDPHVFRILSARLLARSVSPSEIFMLGDRQDNDIEPARAAGWQTWWCAADQANSDTRSWQDLLGSLS